MKELAHVSGMACRSRWASAAYHAWASTLAALVFSWAGAHAAQSPPSAVDEAYQQRLFDALMAEGPPAVDEAQQLQWFNAAVAEPAPALPVADAVIVAAAGSAPPELGEPPSTPRLKLNVMIYGFSYHTDRQGVRREKLDNELNVGLGLNYEFHEDAQGVGFVEAGVYRDSGRTWAKLVGPGYQFKIGKNFRIGAWLVGVQSQTYMHGEFFIAPLPIASYDFGPVKLNAIYIPRYREYNQFAVFGLTFSIPLRD